MKFIMTVRFNYVVEKYNLFFKKHFKNCRNTTFEHVLHYVVKKIHLF